MSDARRAFLGNALHTPTRGQIEFLPQVLIEVDGGGTIQAVHRQDSPHSAVVTARHRAQGTLVTLEHGQFLLPGLIDLHVHAPQWPQLGLALDLPLRGMAASCTFPLEARYVDTEYARTVYESLVEALLANGTTTAVYFATIHLPATPDARRYLPATIAARPDRTGGDGRSRCNVPPSIGIAPPASPRPRPVRSSAMSDR